MVNLFLHRGIHRPHCGRVLVRHQRVQQIQVQVTPSLSAKQHPGVSHLVCELL